MLCLGNSKFIILVISMGLVSLLKMYKLLLQFTYSVFVFIFYLLIESLEIFTVIREMLESGHKAIQLLILNFSVDELY